VFNDGLSKVIKNYVKKGSKLYIEGSLQTRKWQGNDGKDNYTTEIVLQGFNSNLILLSPSNNQQSNSNQLDLNNDLDDELPF